MISSELAYTDIKARIARIAPGRSIDLVAVSKTRSADEIRKLAAFGQRQFGENYVQEALSKQKELIDLDLEWHFIGPLQSNKCRDVALHFDWLQSLDREKLIEPLSRHRQGHEKPLMVLIEVNIDAALGKSGCAPEAVSALAQQISAASHLRLRGLMAIPEPHPKLDQRRTGFRRMSELFRQLQAAYPEVDTLSMGMSEDFETGIEEGASMLRIGTALFGPR